MQLLDSQAASLERATRRVAEPEGQAGGKCNVRSRTDYIISYPTIL